MSETFYWHDYETFGTDPARDRPVQFAGVRTDARLEVIGEPLVLFARPARDVLPHPEACLVTGITPQRALAEGVPECRFIGRIHEELARPRTCGVGYNSLRFDDEFTRHTLYRNFFDPYAREWQNGNSRWDIIDLLRAAYALRPEGINWPMREDGLPGFTLEELTAANDIEHAAAHDALSDVHATIAVARLVRQAQPRLFDYMLTLRDKQVAAAQLDIAAMKPVLHVSGMFGAARANIALIVPLARHPVNRNEIICFDLQQDPGMLEDLSSAEIAALLFTRGEDLPSGSERPGLKSVHVNRCPVLAPAKLLDSAHAARLGIDGGRCREHLARLRRFREKDEHGFSALLQGVYAARVFASSSDPDLMLYSGGFFSDEDRRTMEAIRAMAPRELAAAHFTFQDSRLPEMLFRYRARNFPETLDEAELERWEEYRYQALTDVDCGVAFTLEQYQERIESLLEAPAIDAAQKRILQELLDYGDSLLA